MFGSRFGYQRLFFSPDDDSGGAGTGNGTEGDGKKADGDQKPEGKDSPDPLAGLSETQRSEFQKRIDAASAAARRDGEKAGKTAAEQAIQKAKDDATTKAEQDRQIAAGEFDKVRSTLESERDALAKEVERATKRLQAGVDAGIEALKATKDEALIAGFPKDAPLLDQAEWLDDPRTKAAMAVAGESKKVDDASKRTRTPGTPDTNGLSDSQAASAEQKRLAATGKYTTI